MEGKKKAIISYEIKMIVSSLGETYLILENYLQKMAFVNE